MKKIILLIALVLIAVMLTGCGTQVQREDQKIKSSMFVIVESTMYWWIVYDVDTKVMYQVSTGAYNYGNFCLLVNADGTPKLWKGE